MRTKWRAWVRTVPVVLAAVAGSALAQPASRIDALEAALDRRDPYAARSLLEEITIARRPADSVLRVDPLLSGLFGRFYLQQGNAFVAVPYLELAQAGDAPNGQWVETRLALAEAYDLTGSGEAAERILDALGREALSPRQSRRLALALASREMLGRPAAALESLAALPSIEDPILRFETDLLVARAQSLAGNPSAAREAATRAWSAAAFLPAHSLAPIRSALVLAGLATERADRDLVLGMLTVARASEVLIERDLTAFLPICGEEGVTESDRVVFAVYRDLDWQRHVPVAASRPSIVAPFVHALAGRTVIVGRNDAPVGTLVAVRCRSVPSEKWRDGMPIDPAPRVFAENGIYVPERAEWDGERVSTLEQMIADREARSGADDPALVPWFSELIQRVEDRVRSSGGPVTGLADLNDRMTRAMRRLNGADRLMLPIEAEIDAAQAATNDPGRALEVWRSMMIDRIARLDFASAFELTRILIGREAALDEAEQRRLVEGLLRRADIRSGDPRRRALLMRLGEMQADRGDFDGAIASFRAAGASDDSCLVAHNGIRSSGGEISDDSYPEWAARYGVAGTTAIEYGVDAEGRIAGQRVIFSVPGGLFDAVATEAFGASYRYVPVRAGSRPRSCGGAVAAITWRMADEHDEEPSAFDWFGPDPT